MKQYNRKEAKQILLELEQEFSEGARITVSGMVHEFFAPKGRIEYIVGDRQVRIWLNSLKNKFRKQGLFFGNVDDFGNYGLCLDRNDYAYVFDALHKQAKGIVKTAVALKKEAVSKGQLPEGNPVRLLAFEVHKKEEQSE